MQVVLPGMSPCYWHAVQLVLNGIKPCSASIDHLQNHSLTPLVFGTQISCCSVFSQVLRGTGVDAKS